MKKKGHYLLAFENMTIFASLIVWLYSMQHMALKKGN